MPKKLSVQVHPDDNYALSIEGEYGKTEMWYVVDCGDGAELVYGFKEEFERRIKDNTLTDVCNSICYVLKYLCQVSYLIPPSSF